MPTKWYTQGEIEDAIALDLTTVFPAMPKESAQAMAAYIMLSALGEVFHGMQPTQKVAASPEAVESAGGYVTEV